MKKLLVCLDSSPRAPHVLDAAVDLARRTGAKVFLFRSVGLPPDLARLETVGVDGGDLLEALLSEARKEMDGFAAKVPAELLAGTAARVGTPWDGICREAVDTASDVIVIGSHGYGAPDRLLGTTAAKVVNHADRSVLVVR